MWWMHSQTAYSEETPPAYACWIVGLARSRCKKIAAENNLSETAFLTKIPGGYGLKWFTPKVEMDLCGHATLASAYVISRFIDHSGEPMRFDTLSGCLTVTPRGELLEMDFPARPPESAPVTEEICRALGVHPIEAGLSRDLLVCLETEEQVRKITPDMKLVEALPVGEGLIVTARGDKADFVSRCFYPKLGIAEDPVTGSAHSTLIPYWSQKLNKQEMEAWQVSARGGVLYCTVNGERVNIAGRAALYLQGEIFCL